MIRILTLALLVLAAWAPKPARADAALLLGGTLSDAKLSGLASSTSPTLFSGSLTGTLGYVFGDHFLLGGTSSYGWVNQYSDTAPPVGNWRGSRWNIVAPTVALLMGPVTLEGQYEFLGSYKLSQQAADGSSVSYESPSGYTLSLTYALVPRFNIGAFYRQVAFKDQNSSAGGSTTLGTPLRLTEYGLTVNFALFGGGN